MKAYTTNISRTNSPKILHKNLWITAYILQNTIVKESLTNYVTTATLTDYKFIHKHIQTKRSNCKNTDQCLKSYIAICELF